MHPNDGAPAVPAGLSRFAGLGRCLVMGVVNVTPDSFSDGGAHETTEAAIAHGLRLLAQGADLLDVGGESTRPGAARTSEDAELARVQPVVQALASSGAVVSIDTMRAKVARAALAHGASLVNDVSGGLADPAMAEVVAEGAVPFICSHWRRDWQPGYAPSPVTTESLGATESPGATESNPTAAVCADLRARIDALTAAGVAREQLILDPGLGFGKTSRDNWHLLANLAHLRAFGLPVLVGASRKRFLAQVVASSPAPADPATAPGSTLRNYDVVQSRDHATTAISALAAANGAWGVRVHSVAASRDAVRVAQLWNAASPFGRGPE